MFPLTFTTNACTREYEAPRTQGIVLDFVFLRGCLGNEEGLPLEVCETLGNKNHHDSHLFHSITLLNLTPFQPGMLSVCCVSGGAAQISTDSSACPLPPHSDFENSKKKNDIFHRKRMSIQTPLQALLPFSLNYLLRE